MMKEGRGEGRIGGSGEEKAKQGNGEQQESGKAGHLLGKGKN